MKLYATVTSERATKGQGGNQYLLIDLLDEKQNKFLQIHITQAQSHLRGEHHNIYIYNPQAEYIDISQNDFIEIKAHNQKAHDPRTCENSVPCFDCEEIGKGKKQKGKYCNECMATPCKQQ